MTQPCLYSTWTISCVTSFRAITHRPIVYVIINEDSNDDDTFQHFNLVTVNCAVTKGVTIKFIDDIRSMTKPADADELREFVGIATCCAQVCNFPRSAACPTT